MLYAAMACCVAWEVGEGGGGGAHAHRVHILKGENSLLLLKEENSVVVSV